MIYISDNGKLIEFLEKFLNGTAGDLEKMDARDLISYLKSDRPEMVLQERSKIESLHSEIEGLGERIQKLTWDAVELGDRF